tara:strand:+ start:389 stop:529 length:141 start_codon:yes stop_codon:yes gene_type:complete
MSHKGSWNRVKDHKAWNESPLWDNIKRVKEQAKLKNKNKPKTKTEK